MDFSTVTVTGAQQAFAEEVRAFLGERLTVEVFRTIIAQHDLGLPRPDYPGRKVFLAERRPTAAA
jgi:hypothetical protein